MAKRHGLRPQKSLKATLEMQGANWESFGLFGIRSGSYKSHLFNQKTLSLGVRFPEVNYTNQDGSVIEKVQHGEYVKAGRADRKKARMDRANAKARSARIILKRAARKEISPVEAAVELSEAQYPLMTKEEITMALLEKAAVGAAKKKTD